MVAGPSMSRRATAAFGAVVAEALLLYAMIFGFALTLPAVREERLTLFDVPLPPPPIPVPPPQPPSTSSRREGAASPPNLRSEATQVVAPKPVIPLPLPPPVVAAPVQRQGAAPTAGAADIPGPGFGSGGVGDGTGSGRGGYGDGAGNGLGNGRFTPPRRISGRLSDRDFPSVVGEAGGGGTVSVRFTVEVDGQVGRCVIEQSSGNRILDDTTCRLIRQRYRFRPSLDPRGRPVRSQIVEDHDWVTIDDPPTYEGRRRRMF
jgi:periplasmic protein TonB